MSRAGKRKGKLDPLRAYRRLRKRVPPPERVEPDRRRKIREEETRREIREDP